MRGALCRLIECTAQAGLEVSALLVAEAQQMLDDNLAHANEEVNVIAFD
jgi:hypothetical protein